jgi:hypothetical protein
LSALNTTNAPTTFRKPVDSIATVPTGAPENPSESRSHATVGTNSKSATVSRTKSTSASEESARRYF